MLKIFLEKNQEARKIFGKKEIEIVLKQLSGRKLKQSERNRLSRDIKPKLKFIKEISKFEDEFELKKNQDNKNLIARAKNLILNDPLKNNIKAILLFGSFADKTFTKRSDIDICVIFKKNIPIKEATKFRIRILGELPDKMDIQVFDLLPQKLKRSIARNHKILYKTQDFDNINFSIIYLKDDDFFIRSNKIFGGAA